MPSPLVRHHRLAAELRAERKKRGMTAVELARKIYQSRLKITRLENATIRPNVADVIDVLTALGVTGERWHELVKMTTDANERGWWEDYLPGMGERQAMYANLEYGAKTITEYQIHVVPGLLQTVDYINFRWTWDELKLKKAADPKGPARIPKKMIDARLARQRMLQRPDGPLYETIIEELAVRRLSAPPEVMQEQLRHLVEQVNQDRITVRILPTTAVFADYWLPRSPSVYYTFADGDPDTLAIDTETRDLVYTEPDDVIPYTVLFDRLRTAALSVDDSAALLTTIADSFDT